MVCVSMSISKEEQTRLRKEALEYIYNIVRNDDEFALQHNYYMDGEKFMTVIPPMNSDRHSCQVCSRFCDMGDIKGYCDIFNILMGAKDNQIFWTGWVANCEAYDPVEQMNVIKSMDDMVAFIERTKNFFQSEENFESYYGFERQWNEETGEILETVPEYYERGGRFERIPDKFPCVVHFDWNCEQPLEWIYIGDV